MSEDCDACGIAPKIGDVVTHPFERRDQIEHAGRKRRNGKTAPAVKLSRVKIAMPQGASVIVSGNELSMADVVELLAETLKEARKAAEQFDVRTFQSMMKDKAKG